MKTGETTTLPTQSQLTVGNDGYTPNVYALPTTERTLSVTYDYQTFRTSCESPILDAGKAGYMLLPTATDHNGWEYVVVEKPALSEVTASAKSDKSVTLSATVLSSNNGILSETGFVYSTTENPTLESNLKKVSCGTAKTLSSTLHDLTPVTTYYVKAFATNERGTSYSSQLTFTTTATPTVPGVRTGVASNIQAYSASVLGTIPHLGEVSEVTQHGHVWSTSPNPTLTDRKTQLGATSKTGDFTSQLTGLAPNTKYYVRAYAVNSVDVNYGEEIAFTTDYAPVELTTGAAVDITSKSASVTGTVTYKGGHQIAECGVCWSTTPEPTLLNYYLAAASVSDKYVISLSGLKFKTTYHARAYVITSTGRKYYGNTIEFTTLPKEIDVEIGDYEDDEYWEK